MKLEPFRALRPQSDYAARVASVPYDVVDTEEACALGGQEPCSFLHVTRPEIDLAAGARPESPEAYAKAAENFERLQREGVLVREPAPVLYVYRQRMGTHVQHGLVGCCHIDAYENGVIRRHERTKPQHEDDRARLIDRLGANTGPIFLTYRGRPEIDALVRESETRAPLFEFTASDGVAHTVWRVREPGPLAAAFEAVPACYIADGHHRAAGAVRVGKARRAANPGHTGSEPYNWFLSVLFPASQLQILPYNRCVRDLNGLSATAFLAEVGRCVSLTEGVAPVPSVPHHAAMYLGGTWYGLSWSVEPGAAVPESLDVGVLQDRILAPILGIDDPRTNERISFVGGPRGIESLCRIVDGGAAAVAFSMFPTSVEQLLSVADSGAVMPPKSTWFEPKLRSGLFVHTLDET